MLLIYLHDLVNHVSFTLFSRGSRIWSIPCTIDGQMISPVTSWYGLWWLIMELTALNSFLMFDGIMFHWIIVAIFSELTVIRWLIKSEDSKTWWMFSLLTRLVTGILRNYCYESDFPNDFPLEAPNLTHVKGRVSKMKWRKMIGIPNDIGEREKCDKNIKFNAT